MTAPADMATRIVLVVEDSPTQAEMLRALLEEGGYVARVARTAEEALVVLGAPGSVPDLVLSDVVMPGMSGFDLCRAIKADPRHRALPVVLLTSLADPLDVMRGLEAGADNYITKPYDPALLLARLVHVFAARATRPAPRAPATSVPVTFLGNHFSIASGREEILDVLISSFEDLIRTNAALQAAQAERAMLHERERRARLEAEDARHKAEEARRRAEEANRAKSDFLAMMSHDLRTPLNAIGGYAELLALGVRGAVSPEQTADLERIKSNQLRLLGLVNDLLNFARLERGEVPLDLRPVPVHETLGGMHGAIEPQMREKGVEYAYRGCDPALYAFADRERMEQVLINLLTNAVKFTPGGGRVELSCRVDGDVVAIEVCDTGVGIPADKLDAIFDPFMQVDARRHGERQGVGLGLAISRDLSRRMRGDLSVRSTVGAGTTFTFTLPRVAAPGRGAVEPASGAASA